MFTPDCVVDYGPPMGGAVVGRRALKETITAGLGTLRASSHHLSNACFAVGNDGTAKSVSYVYAWHRWVESKPDSIVMGQYHDEFQLYQESWRISKRVFGLLDKSIRTLTGTRSTGGRTSPGGDRNRFRSSMIRPACAVRFDRISQEVSSSDISLHQGY
ncbi:nuclear transport factor 2 family protein [Williamsia soli]|uniref:nuclear transport factor 2 family protein n=1 Tax=Williamsia soli TaxID=364929 RepID=UPI001A9FD10B